MGQCCVRQNQREVDLSHFEVQEFVGQGAFGKVFKVMHCNSRQVYAMKQIEKCQMLKSEKLLRSLWKERRLLAIFNFVFVMRLIYAFQDQFCLYFVLPFLPGGDLRYRLKDGPMSEQVCRFYVCEVLLGLEYVHGLRIVLRDLKPENLLIDENGHIHLADFGTADRIVKKRGEKLLGKRGTFRYMAPELVRGDDYDYSVDYWSLGCIICEFLTSFINLLPVSNGGQKVSDAGRSLILGLLEKDPKKRLGCGEKGIQEIKNHEFFAGVNWDDVKNLRIPAPWVPKVGSSNHNSWRATTEQRHNITPEDQRKFDNFRFCTNLDLPEEERMGKRRESYLNALDRRYRRRSNDSTFSCASVLNQGDRAELKHLGEILTTPTIDEEDESGEDQDPPPGPSKAPCEDSGKFVTLSS